MRRAMFVIMLCLVACSGERAPERNVDTSLPDDALPSTQNDDNGELAMIADEQFDDCTGRWVYINTTETGLGSLGLLVDQSASAGPGSFEMQFSDFGRDSGSWTGSGTLGGALQLAGEDSEYLLSECSKTEASLKTQDTTVKLERATGNLFEEAAKRGLDYSEHDE